MSRARRPADWERDLSGARRAERDLLEVFRKDARLQDLGDHTREFDRLDFSFRYMGTQSVQVDLKEKLRPTSRGLAGLWPEVSPADLFVVDETVYRRIVWHGGGGYLIVHDHPGARWAIFGPWELTLGPRVRYRRRERKATEFLKGKLLLDLTTAGSLSRDFRVDDLLAVLERSTAQRDAVEAVPVGTRSVPVVGI